MTRSSWLTTLLIIALTGVAAFSLGNALLPASPSGSSEVSPADTFDLDPSVADTATFGGGCFWCMEPPYDKVDGVKATISGFSGGHVEDPSYQDVTSGGTGHAEVVQVIYDNSVVSYERLLDVYWRNVDLFDDGGQFCDRGDYYRPVIFAHTDEQRNLAEASKEHLQTERFDQSIRVPVEDFEAFYRAEEYHQNYYQKNPDHYEGYRSACGRDARLEEIWGDEAGG